MKALVAISILTFTFSTHAIEEANINLQPIKELLSSYESSDINNLCNVELTKENVLKISTSTVFGNVVRPEFAKNIEFVSQKSQDVTVAEGGDYDGNAKIYFVKEKYSLTVIGTWTTNELDVDQSSFCELPIKK